MIRHCSIVLVIALAAGLLVPTASAGTNADQAATEIAYLIDLVRKSDCAFIRNDVIYDGKAAADHIQQKYDYYKNQIGTTDDFIRLAASKSMLSGRPYMVRCSAVAAVPAADWLHAQLDLYRAQHDSGTGTQSK
ncbi:MAG TPA: DUF5329 domain-containing protein [Candidatus Cybelea sp.]|nr:DUF5329 domain-containing protein [Candidatus Cybelea sp.]